MNVLALRKRVNPQANVSTPEDPFPDPNKHSQTGMDVPIPGHSRHQRNINVLNLGLSVSSLGESQTSPASTKRSRLNVPRPLPRTFSLALQPRILREAARESLPASPKDRDNQPGNVIGTKTLLTASRARLTKGAPCCRRRRSK